MRASGRKAVITLAALVVVSAGLRGSVALAAEIPWISPDEFVYALMGESLWERGTLGIRGLAAPYTSLITPALVGAPLSVFGHDTGIAVAQFLQSLVMATVAIPVFFWARRLVAPSLAWLAAVLTLLVPGLAYGGTLMTEAAFYPLALAALATAALVLEQPTLLRQGSFFALVTLTAAVRMQALVLVPTLVVAALVHARITRSWSVARALAPLGMVAVVAAALVGTATALIGSGSAWNDLLGAYQPVLDSRPAVGDVLASIAGHAAGIAVVSLALPLVGTIVVCVYALRVRSSGPYAAYAAVAVAYVPLLVLQVGAFAAQNVGYVSQRYLLTAAPIVFIGFAVWLDRGAPRPRIVIGATAAAILVAAVLVPIDDIVPGTGAHDALWTTWLHGLKLDSQPAAKAVLVAATALVLATLALPRRRLPLAAALVVVVGLAATSITATRTVLDESDTRRTALIGAEPPSWIRGPVTDIVLLASGDHPPGAVADTFFWNPAIASVLRLPDAEVTVPPSPPVVELGDDGVIRAVEGEAVTAAYVLTSASIALRGRLVAQRLDPSAQTPGWRLWRLDGPARVTTRVLGVLPNGDFSGRVTVLAPGCGPGALELTLLGKSGDPVAVTVDGIPWGEIDAPAEVAVSERVPAPPYADGTHTCVFSLETQGYVGSTRITYVDDAPR